MLFFLFGWGAHEKPLGDGALRTCPRCHNTSVWQRLRVARQVTVFFVPVARWHRKDVEVCGICGASVVADVRDLAAMPAVA